MSPMQPGSFAPRLNGQGAGVARSVPLGDDWVTRRLREQDERIMQNLAAMRVMVGPLAQAVAAAEQAIDDVAAAQVVLTAQQATLTTQQATLTDMVDLLTAVADVKYAESTTQVSGFTGFYTGALPEVTLSTPSGRIEIAYGGSLNGGEGYFCFSVTGAVSGALVTAASVQANPARRVAVTGGASFAPSGHRSMVLTVPPNEVLTVQLAYYAASTFVYFFGGSILARVTP